MTPHIKPGDLIKLRWDHPLSIFSKDVVTNNKTMLNNINECALELDIYPTNGDPDAAYYVDAIRNEDCWKYNQNHEPILYLGSKTLEMPENNNKVAAQKIPYVIHKFLWSNKKMYTLLGGWKSSKIEDYFYLVTSEKDFQKKPATK